MSDYQIKLSYNSAQRLVRADFELALCLEDDNVYKGFIEKAKSKLNSEVNQGNIDFYEFYGDRLTDIWSTVRNRFKNRAPRKLLSVVLGQGARFIQSIEVAKTEEKGALFDLTFNAPAIEISNWRYEWVYLNIAQKSREIGIETKPNEAQILGAWLRACEGERIASLPISAMPEWTPNPEKPFKLSANRSRREIAITIHDPKVLTDKERLNAIIKSSAEATQKMSIGGDISYGFRKNELMTLIKSCINGPEILGIGLPIVFLVSQGQEAAPTSPAAEEERLFQDSKEAKASPTEEAPTPQRKKKKKGNPPGDKQKKSKRKKAKEEDYPGKGILVLDISEDNMEACVTGFDMLIYTDANFQPTKEWLAKELAQYGVLPEPEKNYSEVAAALTQRKDINGMMIARGKEGRPAAKPFIHRAYLDVKLDDSGEAVDHREARTIVKPGDLIIEVRYKEKMIPGKDIYGNKIIPEDGDSLVIDMGHGIEMREPGKYYATVEGQPKLENNELEISEVFIHKGNINLKSGDIYFNGPATIQGNIEAGATVMVKGDLEVTGSVEAAFVRSGGNIVVKGGITTTDKGRIHARGDVLADYIGNSVVACGGDIKVKKAILNCSVIAGGGIFMSKSEGTLAGGDISCRSDIHAAKVGFPKGDRTNITVGLDWRAELTLRIRKGRLFKLKQKNEEDRKALRELVRKKDSQMTAKHRETLAKLQENLQRQRELMDVLTEKIAAAEDLMSWDKEAKIFCYETLSTNVEIVIGGINIPISMEVAGVSLRAARGRAIKPITEDDDVA